MGVTSWCCIVLCLGGLQLADRKAACADQKTVLSCLHFSYYLCLQLLPSPPAVCVFLGREIKWIVLLSASIS